jgi:hypothetical protein
MPTERNARNRAAHTSTVTRRRNSGAKTRRAPDDDYVTDYSRRAVVARAGQGLPPAVEDRATLDLLAGVMASAKRARDSAKRSA